VCRLRTAAGHSQEYFSEKAEISRRDLQEIEAGRMNPTVNVMARIRAALGCPWVDLLRGI
jgi:transcriptional regulator with XRE-family HTH domain